MVRQKIDIYVLQVVDKILQYFKDHNEAEAYFAILDVDGNTKVLFISLKCHKVVIHGS